MSSKITIIFLILIFTSISCFADSISSAESFSSAGAGFEGDVGSNNKSYGAPIPGNHSFGHVINYFGNPLPTENYQPLEKVIMYSCWFNRESLELILKNSKPIRSELKIINPSMIELEGDQWIQVIVSHEKYESSNLEFIGFITSSCKSRYTTTVEIMASSALKAMNAGANIIHFTAQGAARDVFSSGWGIGLSITQAKVGDQGNDSNVTSGGFGYSSATAGTRDLPWLQGFALLDHNLKTPKSKPIQ